MCVVRWLKGWAENHASRDDLRRFANHFFVWLGHRLTLRCNRGHYLHALQHSAWQHGRARFQRLRLPGKYQGISGHDVLDSVGHSWPDLGLLQVAETKKTGTCDPLLLILCDSLMFSVNAVGLPACKPFETVEQKVEGPLRLCWEPGNEISAGLDFFIA